MSSAVTAIGGVIVILLAGFTMTISDASKEVWTLFVTLVLTMLAVIYDCGRRILEAEKKKQASVTKDELGLALSMLEKRIFAIRRMSDDEYREQAETGDEETMRLMKDIGTFLGATYGFGETVSVSSSTGMPEITLDVAKPKAVFKTATLKYLDHVAANLKKLMERVP